MRYVFDSDLHIHSHLSFCSGDPEQTTEKILEYAKKYGLNTVCVTDHFWDENVPGASDWYSGQNYGHISASLPLPCGDGVRFLFGAETELDKELTLGVSKECFEKFDFVIIPTTHLHMDGFTCRGDEDAAERAKLWCDRLDAVLDMDIPFYKVGIAHLTCSLMYRGDYLEVLDMIDSAQLHRLFSKASQRGVGIELNFSSTEVKQLADPERILRIYRIAKEEGCKFYFGCDAHHPDELFAEKENAETIIDMLSLQESDKFTVLRQLRTAHS